MKVKKVMEELTGEMDDLQYDLDHDFEEVWELVKYIRKIYVDRIKKLHEKIEDMMEELKYESN